MGNERLKQGAISLCMFAGAVFGSVDGVLARTNDALTTLPNDESRIFFVGAALLGFVLSLGGDWATD